MSRFNAGLALQYFAEGSERIASGEKNVPVGTAVVAVLAALATLFANHSSITSLAYKNEALRYQSQANDQYNFYESRMVRTQIDDAFLESGTVGSAARPKLEGRLRRENALAVPILEKAQSLEERSNAQFADSERVFASYESYEIAAVVFEITVVLASITALTRGRVLLLVCVVTTLVGSGFLVSGFLH